MPAVKSTPTKPGQTKAKGAQRAKSGCYTCRIRRKKCDEQRDGLDRCSSCVRLRLECLGFGEKRPDWMRETHNVNEIREKIKKFLASQGMIKGHSGTISRSGDSEPEMLRLSPDGYSSSSSSSSGSPASATTSLASSDVRYHGLITSSERDLPHWGPGVVDHSVHPGLTPSPILSPDNPYTPRSQAYDVMLNAEYPHTSSHTLVPLRADQAQLLDFPSRALESSFSQTYANQYPVNESVEDVDISIISQAYLPPLYHVFDNDPRIEELVAHYQRAVIPIQYLLADQDAIQVPILQTIFQSRFARDAACLLAIVHKSRMKKEISWSPDIEQRFMDMRSKLTEDQCNSDNAMAALQLVSTFLFAGGTGGWGEWLAFACQFTLGVLNTGYTAVAALSSCDEKTRFIVKTSLWFDVLASVTTRKPPQLMRSFRELYSPDVSRIDDPSLSMKSIMGSDNVVAWAMAETSYLSCWKEQAINDGRLSIPKLVDRGRDIDQYLQPNFQPDAGITDIEYERYLTGEIFRASTRLYLHSVISGDNPSCPEIMAAVNDTLHCLKRMSESSSHMQRSVVRSCVFSIFICGCLTEVQENRAYLLSLLDSQTTESVGNCTKVAEELQQVWADMAIRRRGHPVPWRENLQKCKLLLV